MYVCVCMYIYRYRYIFIYVYICAEGGGAEGGRVFVGKERGRYLIIFTTYIDNDV